MRTTIKSATRPFELKIRDLETKNRKDEMEIMTLENLIVDYKDEIKDWKAKSGGKVFMTKETMTTVGAEYFDKIQEKTKGNS